jgi:hypothetical protein
MSYVPAVVDGRKGKEWHNPPHESMARDEEDDNVEIGHPAGSQSVRRDTETKYVQYKVRMNCGGLTEEEIYIYDFVPAKYDICSNSMMYATVVSPIAHLLIDYKNLRQAQIRRSHADAW